MTLNQSTGGTQSSDVQKLGTLLVGSGGFYIDGNDRGHDEQGIGEDLFSDRNKSTKFVAIYSQSEINGVTNAWDYQTDQTGTYGWRVYSESDIAGRLFFLFYNIFPRIKEAALCNPVFTSSNFSNNGPF